MKNKIPTAEELFEKLNPQDGTLPKWAKDFAIQFAKLHVKEALKEASEKADYITDGQEHIINVWIDKNSILNSYPLKNIK